MISVQKHELADSVASTLSQLELREEKLRAQERDLKVNADVLAQLYRQWLINADLVKVSLGELELWREQAEAIERSSTHLQTIDEIILSLKRGMEEEHDLLPTCEVDLVVYQTMMRDQTKFNQLAFALIAEHNQRQKQFLLDINDE